MRRFLLALLALAALAAQASYSLAGEGRVALVIGNSRYTNAPELANPANDAKAVAETFRKLGFKVFLHLDLKRDGVERALDEFAAALPGKEAAVLFYSGHGLQIGGRNYLLPVDINPTSERSVRRNAIDTGEILEEMEGGADFSLLILDACRDNPFIRKLRSKLPRTRSAAVTRGLARMRVSGGKIGTIVAFAAAAGDVAADGEGEHSPYTKALLEEITAPGRDIGIVFRRVAKKVIEATHGEQNPEQLVKLTQEFYLKPGALTVAVKQSAAPAKPMAKADDGGAKAGQEQQAPVMLPGLGQAAAPLDAEGNPLVAENKAAAGQAGGADAGDKAKAAKDAKDAKAGGKAAAGGSADEAAGGDKQEVKIVSLPPLPGLYASRSISSRPEDALPAMVRWPRVADARPPVKPWDPGEGRNVGEREKNDSFSTANWIKPRDRVRLRINPKGDRDWFRFRVARKGQLVLTIEDAPENIAADIRIWNANHDVVKGWTAAPRPGGVLDMQMDIAHPGDYLIEVAEAHDAQGSEQFFTLQLNYEPDREGYEPNNDFASAWPIRPDSTLNLTIMPKRDHDWFRFTLKRPGQLDVLVDKVPEDFDIVYRLWNANRDVVHGWVKPMRKGGDTVAQIDIGEPGTYFLEIADNYDDAESLEPYRLNLKYTESIDPFEPNGRFGAAKPIDLGKDYKLTILPLRDHDWLSVDLPQGGVLKLSAKKVPENLDIVFRVWNQNRDVIRDWMKPLRKGGDTAGSVDIAHAGRYYVEIADSYDDARNIRPFVFRADFAPQLDHYEPNNIFAQAAAIRTGGEIPFNILPRRDHDWFKIGVAHPGELKVYIENSPKNLDLVVRVWNRNRAVIHDWIKPYRKGGLTEGYVDLPRAGTYYLEIADGGDDGRSIDPAILRTVFTPTLNAFEPNNNMAEAVPVRLGSVLHAHILPRGDHDWFKFYVPVAGKINARTSNVPRKLDISMRLWNSERGVVGNWVGAARKGGITDALFTVKSPGIYYLEVADGHDDARSPKPFRIRLGFRAGK